MKQSILNLCKKVDQYLEDVCLCSKEKNRAKTSTASLPI